jgi:toxin secretion/phage lysis holin
VGYLVLVIVAAQFDQAMGLATPLARTIAILFLIANESLSILENLAGLGVPIPTWLVSRLRQLREQQDHGGSDAPPPTGTATPVV